MGEVGKVGNWTEGWWETEGRGRRSGGRRQQQREEHCNIGRKQEGPKEEQGDEMGEGEGAKGAMREGV